MKISQKIWPEYILLFAGDWSGSLCRIWYCSIFSRVVLFFWV